MRQRTAFACLLALCSHAAAAQTAPARIAGYTTRQAAAGQAAYAKYCASCHGAEMMGEDVAPALVGETFELRFAGKPAALLWSELRRMPMPPVAKPGSLPAATYADLLAFLLEANGVAPGKVPCPPTLRCSPISRFRRRGRRCRVVRSRRDRERAERRAVAFDPFPRCASGRHRRGSSRTRPGGLADLAPHLRQPGLEPAAPGRSRQRLQARAGVARPLGAGENMASPLVHAGVMYLHTYPTRRSPSMPRPARSSGVTSTSRRGSRARRWASRSTATACSCPPPISTCSALDARTGELIWDHPIAIEAAQSGAIQLRGGPLVAGGNVIQGVESFRVSQGSFVVALDLDTGAESWRFYTVARPGEPGGDTWNDLPLEKRNGGSVWVTGSYDPKLGLVYFGPAPTYDTAPLLDRVEKEGH